MNASPLIHEYFASIRSDLDAAYSVASKARARGLDACDEVEIPIAPDVAARVEGLVGPAGVAEVIRGIVEGMGREAACFEIALRIARGEIITSSPEELAEQAVRTGLALYTEGVVSAPIEGVSRVRIYGNPDGSKCLRVYFAGPIRGAGGTGQAFTLLLADKVRREMGLAEYRPTEDEVARYVEEMNLYSIRTRAGQYVPKERELELIARSCPVCIDGEPTEKYEIGVHKDLPGIESNRVRGGMCLVLSEGLCLKSVKILKMSKSAGLDWDWIEGLVKVKKADDSIARVEPISKYISELVGGRPIFGYPMRRGGFRLRYGRTPFCGIQGKAITAATMEVLREFPVIGTQVKTERPGKGCIVTVCDEIDGPIVKLDDDSVRMVRSWQEGVDLRGRIKEILFTGDLLICYGDFLKTRHPLVPGAWCREWFERILESKNLSVDAGSLSWDEAVELARKEGVPLAPKHTLYWGDLTREELCGIAEWLASKGELSREAGELKLSLPADEGKRYLEILGVEHEVRDNRVALRGDEAKRLLCPLGLLKDGRLEKGAFDSAFSDEEKEPLAVIGELLGAVVKCKAGTYIGASMGRPEKSKERSMRPPVHALFPVGFLGGMTRDLVRATQSLKRKGESFSEFELNNRICPRCNARSWRFKCGSCGARTIMSKESPAIKQKVDLVSEFDAACERVKSRPQQVKAVMGMISREKIPEVLEKGILRAKHGVTVFRDGTCRYDAMEIATTHFRGADAGVGIETLRELGYESDCAGKPVESLEQVIELRPQDIIISRHALEYLFKVASFVDDLLVYHYNLPAFYGAEKPEDLIGKLVICIAPHTSAGIAARVIGYTSAQGVVAHPYLHCACRRNADGDELGFLLLLDGLLNFSLKLLPSSRGGKMDAPLVLMSRLDPKEVDDEVHAMDRAWSYPLEFYEAAEKLTAPSHVKIETVSDELGKAEQYEGFGFTHAGSLDGPTRTRYVQLKNMQEKLDEELDLMMCIRAVDAADGAERVILNHFFPDLYGNLRAFSRQKFRCVGCNTKYRRVPLSGKCNRCGGKLILTISRGSVEKYLELSKNLAEKYALPSYLRQRIMLIEREIASVFENDKSKQFSLADYA